MYMTIDELKNEIVKEINDAVSYDRDAGLYGTQILNAQFAAGKYLALMDVLSYIDLDLFVKIHDDNNTFIDDMHGITEGIYSMRRCKA